MSVQITDEALGRLREAQAAGDDYPLFVAAMDHKDEVLDRYSPLFQPGQVERIDEDALRSFFYIENNRHWTSLYRQVNRICGDMDQARQSLALLVDETQPIETRLPAAIASIKGMGPGIATAILLFAYPEKYGVWNKLSEDGMGALGLLPEFPYRASVSEKYVLMNEVFGDVAQRLDVDLWTLDSLWWVLLKLEADR